jgi:hypothetical protein
MFAIANIIQNTSVIRSIIVYDMHQAAFTKI